MSKSSLSCQGSECFTPSAVESFATYTDTHTHTHTLLSLYLCVSLSLSLSPPDIPVHPVPRACMHITPPHLRIAPSSTADSPFVPACTSAFLSHHTHTTHTHTHSTLGSETEAGFTGSGMVMPEVVGRAVTALDLHVSPLSLPLSLSFASPPLPPLCQPHHTHTSTTHTQKHTHTHTHRETHTTRSTLG
jgi:hypothetical protein